MQKKNYIAQIKKKKTIPQVYNRTSWHQAINPGSFPADEIIKKNL